MRNEVKELNWDLNDELELQIADLMLKAGMEPDAAEKTRLYDCVSQLVDILEKRKNEKKRETQQRIELVLKAFGIVGTPLMVLVCYILGLEFEKTGSIRSKLVSNLVNLIFRLFKLTT